MRLLFGTTLWCAQALLPALAQVSGERQVSIFSDESPFGGEIRGLFLLVMGFAALVLLAFYGGLVYVVLRYRNRGQQPSQITGNARAEIAWTVIPFLIVGVILAATYRSLAANAQPPSNSLVVSTVGHQFWWEFEYQGLGLITANELVVPVGRPVVVVGSSNDVAHQFWPPDLMRNMMIFPGVNTRQRNFGWMNASQPGIYYGQCNQICGASHTLMLFRVVAVPPEQFEQFVRQARDFRPPSLDDPRFRRAQAIFGAQCANCHAVRGTGFQGRVGPSLSFLANRVTLAAGTLDMNRENLIRWIEDPPGIKPKARMPAYRGQLTDEEISELADWLLTLRLPSFDYSGLPKR